MVVSAAYIYLAIALLSLSGFLATTYGNNLANLPDQFEHPAVAFGFGAVALLATCVGIGTVSYLFTLLLAQILHLMQVW
jgi:hypothetical protein